MSWVRYGLVAIVLFVLAGVGCTGCTHTPTYGETVQTLTVTFIPGGAFSDPKATCDQWTVDLAGSQAWHASVPCVADYERQLDPPELTPVGPRPLTEAQTDTFRGMIDGWNVGDWSRQLASGEILAHPTGGWRTVVQVHRVSGVWESVAVAGAEPTGFQTVVAQVKALAGG